MSVIRPQVHQYSHPIQDSPVLPSARAPSFDSGRRLLRSKEPINRHGHWQHGFDREKAPYPLSYDREILEIEALDTNLTRHLRGSVSYVNFDEGPPERVLDLGCGTGAWIVEAAKEWPDCEFVGFDLVDVQLPLSLLDHPTARRIEWKHGNFLTTKLPFDDDEFDHVHLQAIAKAVPENKWGMLFEEINRVLVPGGSIEMIEDDVIFPSLPRWFTNALRKRTRRPSSAYFPEGAPGSPPETPARQEEYHDHALLESLTRAVFESRFINMSPTAILPSYFSTYFHHVTLGPIINFPMPPLPPPQPLPPQKIAAYTTSASDIFESSRDDFASKPIPMNRPTSLSFSSTISASTTSTYDSGNSLFSGRPRTASASFSSFYSPTSRQGDGNNPPPPLNGANQPLKRYQLVSLLNESDKGKIPKSLFSIEQLENLSERSLAMHLYRSYQTILACQEAMWEVLKDKIRNRSEELRDYGWDDDEELEELRDRKRFERLIDRYRSDMQARIALWCSLTGMGWPFPTREALSKAEMLEEERIRSSLLKAHEFTSDEERLAPCRSMRVLVGYKY